MILLFTDFGRSGPYLGQMRLSVERHAPGVPLVDLVSDLTPYNPRAAAYLLASLAPERLADQADLPGGDAVSNPARQRLQAFCHQLDCVETQLKMLGTSL